MPAWLPAISTARIVLRAPAAVSSTQCSLHLTNSSRFAAPWPSTKSSCGWYGLHTGQPRGRRAVHRGLRRPRADTSTRFYRLSEANGIRGRTWLQRLRTSSSGHCWLPDGRLRPNLRTNQLPGLCGSDKTQISSAGPRGDIIPYKPAVIWPQDKRTLAKESAHPTAWLVEKTAVVNDRPPTSVVKRRNQIFMKT